MQITSGILSILSAPTVFNFFQNSVGADKARKKLTLDYIAPKSGEKILDVGCGTGEIVKYFPKNIDYHGYDLSSRYIDHAASKYGNSGKFYCADVSNLTLDAQDKFDKILALNLLHHLDDDEAIRLFNFAKNALKPGGRLITQDISYVTEQSKISKYITSKDRGQNIRTPKVYQQIAEQCFNNIKVDIRKDFYRIPLSLTILVCS